MKSAEGLEWGDYNYLALGAMLPFSFVAEKYAAWCARHVREIQGLENFDKIPKNAILYGLHADYFPLYAWFLSDTTRRAEHPIWVGYHGFWSYLPFWISQKHGTKLIRYSKSDPRRPLEQLVDLMHLQSDRRFGIGIDPFRNNRQVRPRLAQLGIRTQRPFVAARCVADRTFTVLGRKFPRSQFRLSLRFSDPIYPEQLRTLSVDEARRHLQREIDQLG